MGGHAGQAKCTHRTLGKKKVTPRKLKATTKPTKLRSNITPGTVLILLAGRFRGKRVVFLKQLESGLLAVTGPFSVNGVPLRRVNQRFCITTSTKVDAKAADASAISDAFFARDAKKKKPAAGESFFAAKADKTALSDDVESYLKARFSLSSGMYPHELKF